MLLLARMNRQCGLLCNRMTESSQCMKSRCKNSPYSYKRCLTAALLLIQSAVYIVLLFLYAEKAKHTFQVFLMTETEYCYVDYIGHKSDSLKETSCCEAWLGVVCKQQDHMPCPSISVHYKLPEENFRRAGYINYWDPSNLLARYATNSHCMIVPITCPDTEDRGKYTQAEVNKEYQMKQSLYCHVYKDAPERPLLVKAKLLPHVALTVLLFSVPPITILITLLACIIMKNGNFDSNLDRKSSIAVDGPSEKVLLSQQSEQEGVEDEESTASV